MSVQQVTLRAYVWQDFDDRKEHIHFIEPLSSAEPFSLALMSYLKMAHVQKYQVKLLNNCHWWSFGKYPVLELETESTTTMVSGWHQVVMSLRSHGYDLNASLGEKQQGNVYMFSIMVLESIRNALDYYMFVDKENFHKKTRPQFIKYVPYMCRFFAIDRMRDRIEKRLLSTCSVNRKKSTPNQDEERSLKFYDEASKAFKALDSLLDSKNFFFGPNPTSLDALVFGFVAPILFISMPKDTLRRRLDAHPNLIRYCYHMRHWLCDGITTPLTSSTMSTKDYFWSDRLLKTRSQSSLKKRESHAIINDYRKGRVFAIIIGLGIMLLYIYIRGKDTIVSIIRRQNSLRAVDYLTEMPI